MVEFCLFEFVIWCGLLVLYLYSVFYRMAEGNARELGWGLVLLSWELAIIFGIWLVHLWELAIILGLWIVRLWELAVIFGIWIVRFWELAVI